jgi:hypothetical protein
MLHFVKSVEYWFFQPDPKDFTEEEQERIDFEGLRRYFIKVSLREIDPEFYEAFKYLVKIQYKIPIKYLKPVREMCSYISQKSMLYEDERDIRNASITIEPSHANFFNMIIPHLPINQALPLETVFTINVKIPFLNDRNGLCPVSKFIWSNNLKTKQNISEIIENEKPKSSYKKPFLENVHFGAIDIGSELKGKFVVSMTDKDLMQSYSLFGFRRSDEQKEFMMWIYNYYNISMSELLDLIEETVENDKTKLLMKEIKQLLPRQPVEKKSII